MSINILSGSGIVHNAGTPNGELVHLPLEEVRITALIVDISARVTLTQSFVNPSDHATSKAVYHFPVPASAAICGFEMRLGDGRIIKGISKNNKEATEEFEKAVLEGREASLLKWVTDDIFTISIGAIRAHQTVETKLVYVMNLMNENTDQIRFHLPMHVGQRYGELPQDLVGSSQPSSHTRVKINIDVQTSGRILTIESPTHVNDITTTPYQTHLNRPSRRRSTIKYRSKYFLQRDFILLIEAETLDSPRCFAELEGDPDHKASLALQLAVVPKFNLSSNRPQEYIFVVDRSGSMQGDRIETAKRTLSMLLRMLPQNHTVFNLVSFGSQIEHLWTESQAYTQHTLEIATSSVERMEANFGGTEIFNAMRDVLNSRRSDIATAVFLLTDGESLEIDSTTRLVRNTADSTSFPNNLRVYVLGIGDTVSTAMCEGIARAGNGVCLFAHQAESIMYKCARLLRAGRTPFIKNVSIDWGLSNEYLVSSSNSVSFSSPTSSTPSSQWSQRLKSFPVLQQAPTKIDDIHAGLRFTVYAILRLKKVRVPEEVVLRGNLDDTGEPFEWHVPIRGVQLTNSEPGLPTIHTLAAWRLIQEHDTLRAPLPIYAPIPGTFPKVEELHEAAIIRLGETYQLASRHTSFVAVNSGSDLGHRSDRRADFGSWTQNTGPPVRSSSQGSNAVSGSTLSALISGLGSLFSLTTPSSAMPGDWPGDAASVVSAPANDDPDEGYETSGSAQTFTTMSSIFGWSSDWSDWDEPSSPHSPISQMEKSPPPQFVPTRFAPPHMRLPPPPAGPSSPPAPLPLTPGIVDRVKAQLFDGSYPLDEELRLLVGEAAINELMRLGVDDVTWATALSIAYVMNAMGNQKELLDDLLFKSLNFLRSGGNEHLVQRATDVLSI